MSDQETRRMQVKVLYSFNNNATIFLSRSKNQYAVKIAHIPMANEDSEITLGAFDLKSCVQQIVKSSPDNFKLHSEDYVVYYKDTTEQPDEPFVANGELSSLLSSTKQHLIPGRVCQNLSASYLFGDKSNSSSLTLEIRLKLHTIERNPEAAPSMIPQQSTQQQVPRPIEPHKRANESQMGYPQKRARPVQPSPAPSASSVAAVKATRTKSLPIFNNIPSQTMFNIMNHDKLNLASKYDAKSVQDRFKSAPFLQAKIIDKPVKKHRRYAEPQRAMRTRSMVNQTPTMISSPINEEPMSDSTDDTEYRENQEIPEDEEEEDGAFDELSPYTPQQPPYDNQHGAPNNNVASITTNKTHDTFQSLPDLEDLDSKKCHTIPHTKLPKNHGLVCVNSNCGTTSSIAWRYFETGFHPNYFAIHRATEFDKKHYEGMYGPLCNACHLFLRNKGFHRPENVVKKYLQQQRYKKELKNREEVVEPPIEQTEASRERSNSLSAIAIRKSTQYASSPVPPQAGKFATPSHTPSAINQVIQNNNHNNSHANSDSYAKKTPNYNDPTDFLNQLNNFGGPLTDIDPLPQDQNGVTPPMVATKSNTRIINLYDDGEDKENCPPAESESSPGNDMASFENMIRKSFNQGSGKSSPVGSEWISTLFTEPTPKDQITPKDTKTPNEDGDHDGKFLHPNMPDMKTFTNKRSTEDGRLNKKAAVVNMPSSPFLTGTHNSDELESLLNGSHQYGEMDDEIHDLVSGNQFAFNNSSPKVASRNDTTNSLMSWNTTHNSKRNNDLASGSTPNTDLFSNDDIENTDGKTQMKYNLDEMMAEKTS